MREVREALVMRNSRQCSRREKHFAPCASRARLQSVLLWRDAEFPMKSTRQLFRPHTERAGPTAQGQACRSSQIGRQQAGPVARSRPRWFDALREGAHGFLLVLLGKPHHEVWIGDTKMTFHPIISPRQAKYGD